MRASVGDRIVIRGHKVGQHERHGTVVEVRGVDGGPPYLVRWDGEEGEHLFFPSSDADIEPAPASD
jgi:hypothetical protein